MYRYIRSSYDKNQILNADRKDRRDQAKRTTSPELLRIYAEDPSWYTLVEVAHNPNTPADVLDDLAFNNKYAEESIYEIWFGVEENPNTSPETLRKLSKINFGSSFDDLEKIAANPNTPEDVLWELVDDVYEDVRLGVAKNPNVTEDMLLFLNYGEHGKVRSIVEKKLGITDANKHEYFRKGQDIWFKYHGIR